MFKSLDEWYAAEIKKIDRQMKIAKWFICFLILCWIALQVYVFTSDDSKKTVKPKEPTIKSTIRLKESGCTYLVFSNGQIVPEYGVDGKVVGCGE